ncbi:MAG: Bifunctional protein GlmU [Candidatus Uhrbacteria bacterium GW2011_GWE2_45_35]|uniref:Bifunctional protein GlmU n=1 Tax=Candidatus Uhrbacteria bacterium GW2011_GWE2_45_35 TaxID=1618993 RepID=A0A0G1QA49_9BACT|nr:MAG: Bifunctional protein GlmU [Candidatus Uhrbacteria bacterium GW2011_GWE2_45_35]
MSKNTRVVILAAGKGSRMGADVPKALVPVAGRPMIDYLIDSIKKSGLEEKPIVVIGHDMEKMREYLSDRCEFAIQADQLGTGHALQCALLLPKQFVSWQKNVSCVRLRLCL